MSKKSKNADKSKNTNDTQSADSAQKRMDPFEQFRQEILRMRREERYDKYPPIKTVDEDGDVYFEIPEKFYENKTANSEDLTLIAEIKLYDDPLIPIIVTVYHEEDDK